jgi:uncharacterized protein
MTEKTKKFNRLAQEKSPYLLQHAANPVDWYAWNEEAFQKARTENKPIFLSIGYSTCHWCHVMEHESFENDEIAGLLNQHFVSIKVDREERPDIDSVYMTSVMAMAGQGGWPLSVFLTPDKKPFFGGTYFPPYPKWGNPGFKHVLESISESWKVNQLKILTSSVSLAEIIKQRKEEHPVEGTLDSETLETAYQQYSSHFDQEYGGMGTSPKFPSSHQLSFLLRYAKRTKQSYAFEIVEHTLRKMAQGGIYDHLGGGFHRYSTDQKWQIPHFEKMLYDQATISKTYLEMYQVTQDPFFAFVARETFDYCLRDMQDSNGGFYSAEDADSYEVESNSQSNDKPHKKEGAFYVWTWQELNNHLDEMALKVVSYYYGIQPTGNAEFDPHGEFTGKNVLFTAHSIEETAKEVGKTEAEIVAILEKVRQNLFELRSKRPRPHLDDKILVDWNGLLISSLALGGRILNEPRYTQAAEKAAAFIIEKMLTKEGRLLHRYRDHDAGIAGTLEDYAFFIQSLLDLYETTFKSAYLKLAYHLTRKMIDLFWDERGGFYLTADDAEELFFRQKEIYDGAAPSGNSIAGFNLLRLYHMTLDKEFEEKAQMMFRVFAQDVHNGPTNYGQLLIALDFALASVKEIVIALAQGEGSPDKILNQTFRYFLPHKVLLARRMDDDAAYLDIVPFIKEQKAQDEKTTFYICQNHVCQLPITDFQDFRKQLQDFSNS